MIVVEIIAPDGVVHHSECDEVVIPTTMGQIGVRTGHRPLVTVVKAGTVRVKHGDSEQQFAVSGGFAEVLPKAVSIITRAVTTEVDAQPKQ